MAKIDICLATYNGDEWLSDFLDSLDKQKVTDWRLIVADDGSTDSTMEVLLSHFKLEPHKIWIVERKSVGDGVINNFHDALAASTADYIFLADQDDVWLPQKLSQMLNAIQTMEGSRNSPVLVYSDMQVVDSTLQPLSESWWEYSGVSKTWVNDLRHLLAQNAVPGCAMAMNRSLLNLALPIPSQVPMHDWWLLLVCLVSGSVGYVDSPCVRYRRHQGALTYLRRDGWGHAIKQFFWGRRSIRELFQQSAQQACYLLERMNQRLEPEQQKLLKNYVLAAGSGWWKKRWLLMKMRIRIATLKGSIKFYVWV